MVSRNVVPRWNGVGFRDGVLSPATLRSRQSTARRPSRIRGRELLSIGLGGDGVGLGVSLLPSVGITTTVNLGDLLSSALPPYLLPTPSASSSDPGPSLLSPTAIIPDPTQPGSPTQPSTTSPTSASPTGQTANPDPGTTSSSSGQTVTTGLPLASVAPVRNELSSASLAASDDGGAGTSFSVAPGNLSPPTATSASIAVPTSVLSTPQTLPGNVAQHPPPTSSPMASPSGPPLYNPPTPPWHGRLSTGAIVGIALGALAALACAALALCFLLRQRRARRRLGSKRMSVESARRRLEPYAYDPDDSSRPISSVWTLFGSVSVDPDFEPEREPRREPSTNSLDFQFQFAEKEAQTETARLPGAYSPGLFPSPCHGPSPALGETQPLARGLSPSLSSVHSLHDGVSPSPSHLNVNVPPPSAPSPRAAASSSGLLALASVTDYALANPSNRNDGGLGRSVSGVSRATAAAGEVHSVEAL